MSRVEDVHIPQRTEKIDPTKAGEKGEDDPTYWEKAAKAARSRREYLEETKMSEHIENPEPPPEAPVKISGNINLGDFNLQEQQKAAQAQAAADRQASEERIEKLTKERDDANKALADAQIQHVHQQLSQQIQQLSNSLANQNKGDIDAQLASVITLAEKLGYQKPEPNAGDGALQLQILKIQQEIKREDRAFQRQLKMDERNWQVKLEELKQTAYVTNARLEEEKKKSHMFDNLPERIGGVIAKGLIEGSHGGPMEQFIEAEPQPSQLSQNLHIECAPGEAGTIPCPSCGQEIGIGPTARSAQCANPDCGQKLIIKRVSTSA